MFWKCKGNPQVELGGYNLLNLLNKTGRKTLKLEVRK